MNMKKYKVVLMEEATGYVYTVGSASSRDEAEKIVRKNEGRCGRSSGMSLEITTSDGKKLNYS